MDFNNAMKKSRSQAEKLTIHFDKDWSLNRSTLRAKTADDRSYNPDSSWDAKSDNPVQFSRLQATEMPVQSARPVTLSGHAVVELETKTDGLKILNVHQADKKLNNIPLNREQLDVEMKPDLSCVSELEEKAKTLGYSIIMDKLPSFQKMKNEGPVFEQVTVPQALIEAGPQCDQRLLNPIQRREIAQYEQKKNHAKLYIKDAQLIRGKTRKAVNGPEFHRGILQVDSSLNVDSEIYGERAKKYLTKLKHKRDLHFGRHDRLAFLRSNMSESGNILDGKSIKPGVKLNSLYQSKCMKHTCLTTEETHNRLFPKKLDKYPRNTVREQKLRNQDVHGKKFNIVSHIQYPYFESDVKERLNKLQIHPSQTVVVPKHDFKQFLMG